MTLADKAASGIRWSSLSMVTITLIQFAQIVILARILSPSDFGLMAVMMVIIGFSQAFMDMGISSSIIHRQEISHNQLSSLYWLNIFSGFMVFILVAALSPVAAGFFNASGLLYPLLCLSPVFVIVAIGNQYRILCQKKLQFNLMTKIEIISAIFSLVVSVTLAFKGFGVYALVAAQLVQTAVSSLAFFVVGFKIHHRPAFVYRHKELEGFYGFGLYQMGDRSINYIGANIDKFLIGKFVGMEAAGFYDMAWQLITFPVNKINPIINKVVFPVYAKIQDDVEELNRYYFLTVRTLSLATVQVLAFLSFHSEEIVLIVFGEGWETTATLVALLGAVGILRALGNPGGAILLALGFANIGFWWNLFWAIVVTLGILIALSFNVNVEIVPLVLLGLSLTVGMIYHYLIAHYAKIHYQKIIWHFTKIILVCFMIAWISKEFVNIFEELNLILKILIASVACLVFYMPYLYFFEKKTLSLICTVASIR